MATNQFFQYDHNNEQNLYEDLSVEFIKIFGVNTLYLTRSIVKKDQILHEDRSSTFDGGYEIEAYVKDNLGFQGEGDFLSKFGLQIRDQLTLVFSRRSFEEHITTEKTEILRPREGDLIYFPLNNKMFEITFVEHESIFYQNGNIRVYEARCELFEYSGEKIQTGNPSLDNLYVNIDTTEVTTLEDLQRSDPIADNIFFEQEADDIVDFTKINPFEEQISYPTDT